ncbi:MAG: hypothetical protein IPP08_00930 [Chlorobiota bacterium]|nr:hypothetical protein [Chlorobiota bacterium]QQS66774.1 MAG: hypothetical protein IPP08_00930 [Chlorobiota bacterium]
MYSVSRKILVGIFVIWACSFFQIGVIINYYTSLIPLKVFPSFELWRLVTFPLKFEVFGFFIGIICFSLPSEELEVFLGKKRFTLLIISITLITAMLNMILFYRSSNMFGALGNVSMFVLVGFVYLFPNSELRFFVFSFKSKFLLYFATGIVVIISAYLAIYDKLILPFLAESIYGIILGGVYFHVRYQKYSLFLGPIRKVEEFVDGNHIDVLSSLPVLNNNVQTKVQNARPKLIQHIFIQTIQTNEEILNELLEKIHEHGIDNLTKEEKNFLNDYSKKI